MAKPGPKLIDPETRFLALCLPATDEGCRPWGGFVAANGYGRFGAGGMGNLVYAHRWAYTNWVGPIPDGLTVDHICHDPTECVAARDCPHRRCTEPTHLTLATRGANSMRGGGIGAINGAKTHCKHGHPFTVANTIIRRRGNGIGRECRTCHKRLATESRRRRRSG